MNWRRDKDKDPGRERGYHHGNLREALLQAALDLIGPEVGLQTAALGEVGLDLAIVYLRPPLDPAVLVPLADALAPLA